LEAASRAGLFSRGPFINSVPIAAGKEIVMSKVNVKSLCIGLLAGVTLVLSAGAIGGDIRWGPYQLVSGIHTITYVSGGSVEYKEIPIMLKVNTLNGQTWRYVTYADYVNGFKSEGFEQVSGRPKRSELVSRELGRDKPCDKNSRQ